MIEFFDLVHFSQQKFLILIHWLFILLEAHVLMEFTELILKFVFKLLEEGALDHFWINLILLLIVLSNLLALCNYGQD